MKAEEETKESHQDAIRWLLKHAITLRDTQKAENCIQLAYDIDAEITEAEIKKRGELR